MAKSKRADLPPVAEEHAPEVREPDGYRQSDTAVAEQIRQQLAADGIDVSAIAIEVKSCEVTLGGSVRLLADIAKIESCACLVPGVKLVRNNLASAETLAEAGLHDGTVGAARKMGKPGYEH